ncbi:MAG: tRNA uridine-5-carboxymethylaminomethyl(34) synthesis GTPase MnmE [Bacteroidales bacterium]|nr:tRNA uridine-5-carboxymethylaminomethyl(34) synthesis GTPase MnmE [Bacteroidales bacterium]
MDSDTICAVATGDGMTAIGVIRVSGAAAILTVEKVFVSAVAGKRLSEQRTRTLHVGNIAYQGETIDEVVVAIFRGPHSYTGEDVVEISCHGSRIVKRRILEALTHSGARLARAGEFTQRAFLNGRMDLSQAEAVADLIESSSDAQRRIALTQLKGGISKKLKELRGRLVELSSLLELELDFSEEDVEFADRKELLQLVETIIETVGRLTETFKTGNAIKEGVPVAIVGAPNVGKSTLLNALIGEEKAIVSDIAGTTRDTIEDVMTYDGIMFRFIDTAGIRQSADTVEKMGIQRTYGQIEKARVILVVADATKGKESVETVVREVVEKSDRRWQKVVIVANKTDVAAAEWINGDWKETVDADAVIRISAKQGNGLKELKEKIVDLIEARQSDDGEVLVSNARHYEALVKSRESLERVREGLQAGISGELVAIDLHRATDSLGTITGEVTNHDVLKNIFSHFCVGK